MLGKKRARPSPHLRLLVDTRYSLGKVQHFLPTVSQGTLVAIGTLETWAEIKSALGWAPHTGSLTSSKLLSLSEPQFSASIKQQQRYAGYLTFYPER